MPERAPRAATLKPAVCRLRRRAVIQDAAHETAMRAAMAFAYARADTALRAPRAASARMRVLLILQRNAMRR